MSQKRRFGDRKDGRLVRSLPPMNKVSPFIMKNRIGSQNYIRDRFDMDKINAYMQEKRRQGLKQYGILHFMITLYARMVAQRPYINRFLSGQRIYARHNLECVMTIKKELTIHAQETVVKFVIKPDATVEEIYEHINAVVEANRVEGDASSFDSTARILNHIPRVLLRFAVGFLNFLDYFGWLPKSLTDLSPFHGSMVITSMASLGIPSIYHHLYDFGNIPIFISYGVPKKEYVMDAAGAVQEKSFMEYTVVTDERICDGHAFASAMKLMKYYVRHPEKLDLPIVAEEDIP